MDRQPERVALVSAGGGTRTRDRAIARSRVDVTFLSSPEAGFITGVVVDVNGGSSFT